MSLSLSNNQLGIGKEMHKSRGFIDQYVYVATLKEIKENSYNLNIPRYVYTFEEEEVIPLDEVAHSLIEVDREIEQITKKLMNMFNQLVGTDEESQKELDKFRKLISRL